MQFTNAQKLAAISFFSLIVPSIAASFALKAGASLIGPLLSSGDKRDVASMDAATDFLLSSITSISRREQANGQAQGKTTSPIDPELEAQLKRIFRECLNVITTDGNSTVYIHNEGLAAMVGGTPEICRNAATTVNALPNIGAIENEMGKITVQSSGGLLLTGAPIEALARKMLENKNKGTEANANATSTDSGSSAKETGNAAKENKKGKKPDTEAKTGAMAGKSKAQAGPNGASASA
ncbi:hypothetical protein BJ878DRAFT_487258 [Calycina marina]|uniref:Uncharacterized protein n=1 Tax=Calycina marina TaxID=1763456 RepID=A0A9P7ZB52_9HELO|nr:hypothetical protein BJ878DRAFT_487258 [Calycina marina]